MITKKSKKSIAERKKEAEDLENFNKILKNLSYLNDDVAFNDENKQPLTKKEVDALIDGVLYSSESDLESYEPSLSEIEKDALKRARKIRKVLPENKMPQFCMLSQDLLSKMTYQSYLGLRYSDKEKDELLKKFNKRIVRNYILSAILGGLIVGGAVAAPKIADVIQKTVIEKNIAQR